MYDPSVGRFLEEDPIWLATGEPNPFLYAMNSPTNATDPSGYWLYIPEANLDLWRNSTGGRLVVERVPTAGPGGTPMLRIRIPTSADRDKVEDQLRSKGPVSPNDFALKTMGLVRTPEYHAVLVDTLRGVGIGGPVGKPSDLAMVVNALYGGGLKESDVINGGDLGEADAYLSFEGGTVVIRSARRALDPPPPNGVRIPPDPAPARPAGPVIPPSKVNPEEVAAKQNRARFRAVNDTLSTWYMVPNVPAALDESNPFYLIPGGTQAVHTFKDIRWYYMEADADLFSSVYVGLARNLPFSRSVVYTVEICQGKSTSPGYIGGPNEDLDAIDYTGRGLVIFLEALGGRMSTRVPRVRPGLPEPLPAKPVGGERPAPAAPAPAAPVPATSSPAGGPKPPAPVGTPAPKPPGSVGPEPLPPTGTALGAGAPVGNPPLGAKIIQTDPNGKWVIFEDAKGVKKIQFDVNAAENVAPKPLPPTKPDRVETPRTEALVGRDGKVYVTEGMHRLEAAQGGTVIPPGKGGVAGLPGWLEYNLK